MNGIFEWKQDANGELQECKWVTMTEWIAFILKVNLMHCVLFKTKCVISFYRSYYFLEINCYVENVFWKKDKLMFAAWKKFQIVIGRVISLLLWLNKLYCETMATLSCKSLCLKLEWTYCYPTNEWGSQLTHFE